MAGPASPNRASLAGGVPAALAVLPARAGVAQLLAEGGRNLVIGRAANLRRWTASHLGAGRPPKPGQRPPTDLSRVAVAVEWTETASAFHQRVVFERVMARHVPPSRRRDLRPPAYLHLDPTERFPRVVVRPARGGGADLYGPFRDRGAAQRALERLHRLFPLRPCDYTFEPDPELPLGLACLYAQVRSCAAPCLGRVSPDEYRDLARRAARWLADPRARPAECAEWAPPWVAPADARAVVVERTRAGLELFAVAGARVTDDPVRAASAEEEALADALGALRWPEGDAPGEDAAWLSAWLHSPRRAGAYVLGGDGREPDASGVAAALASGLVRSPR